MHSIRSRVSSRGRVESVKGSQENTVGRRAKGTRNRNIPFRFQRNAVETGRRPPRSHRSSGRACSLGEARARKEEDSQYIVEVFRVLQIKFGSEVC